MAKPSKDEFVVFDDTDDWEQKLRNTKWRARKSLKIVLGAAIDDCCFVKVAKIKGVEYVYPPYKAWLDLLTFIYKTEEGKRYYMCEEWHYFSAFSGWWHGNHKEGHKLVLNKNSKIYSPKGCKYELL